MNLAIDLQCEDDSFINKTDVSQNYYSQYVCAKLFEVGLLTFPQVNVVQLASDDARFISSFNHTVAIVFKTI